MISRLGLRTFEISFIIMIDRSDLDAPIDDVFVNSDFAKVGLRTDNFTLHHDIIFNLEG